MPLGQRLCVLVCPNHVRPEQIERESLALGEVSLTAVDTDPDCESWRSGQQDSHVVCHPHWAVILRVQTELAQLPVRQEVRDLASMAIPGLDVYENGPCGKMIPRMIPPPSHAGIGSPGCDAASVRGSPRRRAATGSSGPGMSPPTIYSRTRGA